MKEVHGYITRPLIDPNFGIALCGGGARGLAHIGVLKALEEKKLFPKAISGTSAGSIVGVLYAMGTSLDRIAEIATDISTWRIFAEGWSTSGFTDLKYLEKKLSNVLGESDISDCKLPCYVGMTNLSTGEVEYHTHGNAVTLVKASCAVPPIFSPVVLEGNTYVDGGLVENLPAAPIKKLGLFTIGVNVNRRKDQHIPSSVRDLGMRAMEILISANSVLPREMCDLMIDIPSVYQIRFLDFGSAEKAINCGYEDASRLLADLTVSA